MLKDEVAFLFCSKFFVFVIYFYKAQKLISNFLILILEKKGFIVMNNSENIEFKKCLEKYINESAKIICLDSINDFEIEFLENINKIIIRDNPDGYLKIGNKIFIIEHFEYDATKNNKKGSETRREESRINKKFNIIDSTQKIEYFNETMNISHTTEQLRDNFIKVFNQHNYKIPQYRQKLVDEGIISENNEIIYVFCCEDKTTFGCLCYDDAIHCFNILNITECLEVILKSNINYILLCNSYPNEQVIYFYPVLNEIKNKVPNQFANQIKFVDFKPIVRGVRMRL